MDLHNSESFPFEIGEYKMKRHVLRPDELFYQSTTLQKVELKYDHEHFVSDFIYDELTIHQVSAEEVEGPDRFR